MIAVVPVWYLRNMSSEELFIDVLSQNFKDLLSDEPFTRSDIIVLQDPRYYFLEILRFYYLFPLELPAGFSHLPGEPAGN
jgi:hypothetical protein